MAGPLGNMFGNVNVSTGIDPSLKAPAIAQSAYSSLTGMPQAAASHWMNQTPSLNSLYGMNLLGNNMQNAAALHSLEGQQTAQNNMNLGNMQAGLSSRGLGMATNQALFGMNQRQQLNQLLYGLFGNMFGNMMGMV